MTWQCQFLWASPSTLNCRGRSCMTSVVGKRGLTCVHTHAHTVVRTTWLGILIHCAVNGGMGAIVLACLQDGQPQARESLSSAPLSFCSG